MRSFYGLRDAGVKDLGFAVTIQDDNADDLLNLYRMVDDLDAEFAQAVPHNSYYFHTDDNEIKDVDKVQAAIRGLMEEFLRSRRPKQWFRAYLNRGLVDFVAGAPRRSRVHRRQRHLLPRPVGRGVPVQRPRHEHGQPARDRTSTSSGAAPRPRRCAPRCAPASAAAG